MKTKEIRNLINVDEMFEYASRLSETNGCSMLEAFADYAERNDIDIDLVASAIKANKGKVKAQLAEQCRDLRLID
jgi:hypothetical protein